jgi:ADP-ribose pyrophosphatase YjhB (NUDIX family)
MYNLKFGKWMPPGGHLEANELPEEAALRELSEETGCEADLITFTAPLGLMAADSLQLVAPVFMIENDIPATIKGPRHRHIDFIFAAVWRSGSLQPDGREAQNIKWFRRHELPRRDMFESSVLVADDLFIRVAARGVSGSA